MWKYVLRINNLSFYLNVCFASYGAYNYKYLNEKNQMVFYFFNLLRNRVLSLLVLRMVY